MFLPLLLNRTSVRSERIYGVSWGKGSSPALTRTDHAVNMVANAGVDGGVVQNDFDRAQIFGEMTTVTDALGNTFVRIPRCYIRKTDGVGYKTWQVSKRQWSAEWYLPWCFWDFTNGRALDYIDVGKYVASLDGSNRLESKTGKYPLVSKNIVEFRTYALANGVGYQQLDIHVVDLLQTLFYIEFATLNSQSVMAGYTSGQYNAAHVAVATENGANRVILANAQADLYAVGQSIGIGTSLGGQQVFAYRTITSITAYDASNKALIFDGAAVNIAAGNIVYNTGYKSGFSSGIAASSGSVASNSSGKHPHAYRGIEAPWGNVWQFVDGLNINEYQSWVAKDAAQYASNLFAAPYEQLGYVNHNADGYPTAMGHDANLPFAALPTAVGGDSATYYSDYYYRNTGQRIAFVGGGWNYGSRAGVALWSLYDGSGLANLNVGGRLVRKAA